MDCCCSQVAVTMSIFSFIFLVSNVLFRCMTWQTEWEVMQTMTEEKKSSTFAVKNHSEIPVSMLLLILLWRRKKTGMKNCTPHVQKITTTMMKYNKVHIRYTHNSDFCSHIWKEFICLFYLKIVAIELLLETWIFLNHFLWIN